jgi:Na+(H+)/acetate symporter ActP
MKNKKIYRIPVLLVRLMSLFILVGGIATITFISIFLAVLTHTSLIGIIFTMGIFTTGMFWMLLNQMHLFRSIDAEVTIERDEVETGIEETK